MYSLFVHETGQELDFDCREELAAYVNDLDTLTIAEIVAEMDDLADWRGYGPCGIGRCEDGDLDSPLLAIHRGAGMPFEHHLRELHSRLKAEQIGEGDDNE